MLLFVRLQCRAHYLLVYPFSSPAFAVRSGRSDLSHRASVASWELSYIYFGSLPWPFEVTNGVVPAVMPATNIRSQRAQTGSNGPTHTQKNYKMTNCPTAGSNLLQFPKISSRAHRLYCRFPLLFLSEKRSLMMLSVQEKREGKGDPVKHKEV